MRTSNMRWGAIALGLGLCGPAAAQAPDSPLIGAWNLIAVSGQPVSSGFLAFGPGGEFDGSDGCHALNGHYSVEGPALVIHTPTRACPSPKAPAREKRVKAFQALILQGPEFEIEGDLLRLRTAHASAVLQRGQ
jgi:hypothetical protein